ncbi:SUKH superfamily protein [Chitinophaga polysaccharea]|uniref:SUKH superfamily protein n=2 Tax=Chitinophaga polysaccharea TaxID=1293035 RepID=A0A561P3I5_9BACT|nr:SUKH superfamily protein [Chitinophaga polysaccharea]
MLPVLIVQYEQPVGDTRYQTIRRKHIETLPPVVQHPKLITIKYQNPVNNMQPINDINDIANYLRSNGEDLVPCTEKEVAFLQTYFNVSFPQVYKEFLLVMGKGAGTYMRGTDVFYGQLLPLRDYARETLEEAKLDPLPCDAFVFWMHQGYIYAYFMTDGDENPPVTVLYESGEVIKFDNLFDFFKAELHLDGFVKL